MKILKFTFLTTVILTLGTLFYSCSDDDSLNPISPKDREDTTIGLIYPSTNETGYTISLQGEDVNYSVKSEKDEIVIAEMISTTDLNLKAVSLGETTVTITDNSQNKLVLTVKVDYLSYSFIVKKHDVTVIGGDLTKNEKKEISETKLLNTPVKVGGGYKFIFTDKTNNKGKAIVYTNTLEVKA